MASIGTNIGALSASFYLNQNNAALTKNIKRLSSGSRLADPTDDPAGVAVSGQLDATVTRLQAASDSANDVISFGQTADGFLDTIQQQLTRMSELAEQATNGTFGSSDIADYAVEFNNLKAQINQIAGTAAFNSSSIFTTTGITCAIDANGNTDVLHLALLSTGSGTADATNMYLDISAIDITSTTDAISAISALDAAINTVTTERASINADIAKFNFHVSNIQTETVNVQSADSRIKDLDIATESTALSTNNVLMQAATSMLAQANTSQQAVLTLLK